MAAEENREPAPNQSGPKEIATMAQVVWGLYLASVVVGITSVIGVIIAHVKKGDARGTVYESHFSTAIKTFWICLLLGVVSTPLVFVGVGVLLLVLVSAGFLVIAVMGLVKSLNGVPFGA